MKKLQINNLSPTNLLVVLAVFVFICVPIRVFQLTNCIDSATGFWAAKDFTAILLYVLIGLFILVSLFISFTSSIMTRPVFKDEKNLPLGICSTLFAVSLLYESIIQITNFIKIISNYVSSSNTSLYQYLATSGGISIALEALFGLLSVIYLVFVAISSFKGEDSYYSKRVIALSPVLWAMFRLIYHFVNPVNFKNVSQLFLEIMLFCLSMIFFLSFARIASGINEERSMWVLWFSGTSAALLAFICALAPFILLITGKSNLIPANYPLHLCDLGLAIFITSFLFTVTPLTNEVGE